MVWELREIGLSTPLAELDQPVVLELDSGRAILLPPHSPRPESPGGQRSRSNARPGYGFIHDSAEKIQDLGWAVRDRSIGEVVESHRGFGVRRAFLLPPGQVVLGIPQAHMILRQVTAWGGGAAAVIGVFVGLAYYRAAGAPWGIHIATFLVVVALLGIVLAMLLILPSRWPGYQCQGQRILMGKIVLPDSSGDLTQRVDEAMDGRD